MYRKAMFRQNHEWEIPSISKTIANIKVPGLLAVPEIAVKNRDEECVLKHGCLSVIKRQQQQFLPYIMKCRISEVKCEIKSRCRISRGEYRSEEDNKACVIGLWSVKTWNCWPSKQ